MKKLYRNHNHTPCHPEEKPKNLSRFFTAFRMTVFSRLLSAGMTALVLAYLLLTPSVHAEWNETNCTNRGGSIITGQNSIQFCASKVPMNWWSANVWCQKHGGQLAESADICPGVPLTMAELECPNITNTNLPSSNSSRISWLRNTVIMDEQLSGRVMYRGAHKAYMQWKTPTNQAFAICSES